MLTLIPALTRKSTSTDLTFVWPDLKSSPDIGTPFCSARSMTPGTKVFCGEPFTNEQPSNMDATANSVEADTSAAFFLIELRRTSAVSLRPFSTEQKRSVLAVQRIITYSGNKGRKETKQKHKKKYWFILEKKMWYFGRIAKKSMYSVFRIFKVKLLS